MDRRPLSSLLRRSLLVSDLISRLFIETHRPPKKSDQGSENITRMKRASLPAINHVLPPSTAHRHHPFHDIYSSKATFLSLSVSPTFSRRLDDHPSALITQFAVAAAAQAVCVCHSVSLIHLCQLFRSDPGSCIPRNGSAVKKCKG